MKKVLFAILIGSVMAQANFLSEWFGEIMKVEVSKTSKGFVFNPKRVKTEYHNRIIWGDGYTDHNASDPVRGVAVEVFGDGWKYTTVTDDNGDFRVPVKPDSPFTIRASSGDYWAEYNGTLEPVPKGTIKIDKD